MVWTAWLIPICTTVIGGMILFYLKAVFRKQQKKEDLRDQAKKEETAKARAEKAKKDKERRAKEKEDKKNE